MSEKKVTDDQRAEAALYALDALSPDEKLAFEQQLDTDPVLNVETQALANVVSELGRIAPTQLPPASLRERVLERITQDETLSVIEKPGLRFVRSNNLEWREGNVPAIKRKILSVEDDSGYCTFMVRMAPGASLKSHRHVGTEDSYVLEGDLLVSGVVMHAGDYCRAEAGSEHIDLSTKNGCVFITRASLQESYFA